MVDSLFTEGFGEIVSGAPGSTPIKSHCVPLQFLQGGGDIFLEVLPQFLHFVLGLRNIIIEIFYRNTNICVLQKLVARSNKMFLSRCDFLF